MKRVRLLIAALATTLIVTSCTKDQMSFISPAEAESIIPGSWKVNFYGDASGSDIEQFADYTFEFKDDGTVTATSETASYSGTWVVQISNDEFYDEELVLTIDQMDALNHVWLMTGISEVKMELLVDSGSDQVHFLKM